MSKKHLKMICDISELNDLFKVHQGMEEFLARIVDLVAMHMKADVCSVYLFDEKNEILILKATRGLNPESVNHIELKPGEGIAGLALQEQRIIVEKVGTDNPHFKSFPGINEEKFESYLAVPILRGISRIGVLMLQRKKKNYFKEDDIIALRAITSQLANTIENAKILIGLELDVEKKPDRIISHQLKFIKGKTASAGFAFAGIAVYRQHPRLDDILKQNIFKATLKDFHNAISLTEKQLEQSQQWVEEKLEDAASLIFTSHLLMLKDTKFTGAMEEMIKDRTNPAEAIVRVARKYIDIFASSPAPLIREKVQDIEDLARRLLENLSGEGIIKLSHYNKKIVVAEDLLPSDLFKLAAEKIEGIVLVTGGITSHLAILARSLQIPMIIVDVPRLLDIPENTKLLMDGSQGNIYLNPDDGIISNFQQQKDSFRSLETQRSGIKARTLTRDGCRVTLLGNINLLSDLKVASELKAEGIGLYRTEFPFLIRNNFPTEEEQQVIYTKLVNAMPGKRVTFRTLDIGGDKVLSYFYHAREQNPFLGMRSIRFSLQNKDIFRQQIKAILKAGDRSDLRIMFPMISSLEEFREAKSLVLECVEELMKQGTGVNRKPSLGMMVEIPSVLEIIDELAREVDFFSIGTNDLIQYILAVDRTNEKVSHLYLPHHPSVLRSMKKIVDAALKNNIEVSVCGDMAHQEKFIPFLIGIGVRVLSLDPRYFLNIQKKIQSLTLRETEKTARKMLKKSSIKEIEELLNGTTPLTG